MYYNVLGAFFLQNLATKLNTLIENTNIKVEDKELDNIVLLLCCLYAFKVSEMFIMKFTLIYYVLLNRFFFLMYK